MENKAEIVKEWMRRAESNLVRAKQMFEGIIYEDLCFDAQQCTEKALKALILFYENDFPKTHSIAVLMTLLENQGVILPSEIKQAEILTDYAVTTRYPGDWEPVNEEEYQVAVSLAEQVFSWVKEKLL